MLISCPKCHSIYEIPDDLIGKTGRNFRCQNCSNVWHALKSDAFGYEEKTEDLYIEPLTVSESPKRNYPANRKDFYIPADSKSGRKTHTSQEVLAAERDPSYTPPVSPCHLKKEPEEITLTSDCGTSFTISMIGEEEKQCPPYLGGSAGSLSANRAESLYAPKTFAGYKKTMGILFLVLITILAVAFRREVVTLFPKAELYYNKAYLSGLNNIEYLKFEQISAKDFSKDDKTYLKVAAVIYNDSFYTTNVPNVTISGNDKTFAPKRQRLKGGEKTSIEFDIEIPAIKNGVNLTLGFAKP